MILSLNVCQMPAALATPAERGKIQCPFHGCGVHHAVRQEVCLHCWHMCSESMHTCPVPTEESTGAASVLVKLVGCRKTEGLGML